MDRITGADLVELMGKSCDHLFQKEPTLLRKVHEVMEPAIKLFSEKLQEQHDLQLNQYIANYILQCKTEGKNKLQTEQMLQTIFSLDATDAKEMLEKYW